MLNKLAWDDLNSLEKAAALAFLSETKELWRIAGLKDLPFDGWLNQLEQGIHKAIKENLVKEPHHKN